MTETSKQAGRVRTIEAKSVLFRAHERFESVFVLTTGMLTRERLLDDGCRQIVGLHIPEDVCGLSAACAGIADHDVVALTRSTVIEVSLRSLSSAAQLSGDLMQALWREMALEIGLSAAWTINLGVRPAYQRIAHLACELAARLSLTGHDAGGGVEWPGTQADLGAATGLSVVHVNRCLARLVADGVLASGRKMLFHDMAKLRDIASFDAPYLREPGERLSKLLLASNGQDRSYAANGDLRSCLPYETTNKFQRPDQRNRGLA